MVMRMSVASCAFAVTGASRRNDQPAFACIASTRRLFATLLTAVFRAGGAVLRTSRVSGARAAGTNRIRRGVIAKNALLRGNSVSHNEQGDRKAREKPRKSVELLTHGNSPDLKRVEHPFFQFEIYCTKQPSCNSNVL
jgi:hypothetical protein